MACILFKGEVVVSKKITFNQILVYLLGTIILSAGICLNTKTQLGISPIVSVPYNISQIFQMPLGVVTFFYYCFLIFLQFLILRRNFESAQVMQVIASFLSSFFMQVFDGIFTTPDSLVSRITLLLCAIALTGIGASLTIAMKLIPNPADGLANTIGFALGKNFGFGKNLLDFSSIILALVIGFGFSGGLMGIGLGTFVAMVTTGRVIALVHPFSEKIYAKVNS
ncbi:YczE/YyaS/YitT family protein [Streptococcus henryi]|uniref:YczE/YyaS/YitT family protein n=1 Tax=Streptococcus henryi TaxID=439219 RepID=UPI000374EDED|nr:DUF6198 family protein [Streptococcus henryi]